jgi:hypothetical protein
MLTAAFKKTVTLGVIPKNLSVFVAARSGLWNYPLSAQCYAESDQSAVP